MWSKALFLPVLALAVSALESTTLRTEVVRSPRPSSLPNPLASKALNSTAMMDARKYHLPGFTELRIYPNMGPKQPPSVCKGVSPMCYVIAHGKRDCFDAWQQYEDDKWYCDYTARTSGACIAVFSCEAEQQQTCFKGSYVKEVFHRIHENNSHCGSGGCGKTFISADEIPEGRDTCGAKLDYCFSCKVRNSDPPTSPLPDYFTVPKLDPPPPLAPPPAPSPISSIQIFPTPPLNPLPIPPR
ncbi:MAG: hypothetical protein Q9178_005239 [Gyalolechia marmorata]